MGSKRKRIEYIRRESNVIVDEEAYSENICSNKARLILTVDIPIQISIWFDKHYFDRLQHGDDYGPREGIDLETIKNIVSKYFHHLIFYSSNADSFKYLNYETEKNKGHKIVFQYSHLTSPKLNIVMETHYEKINKFQATIKTAMCEDSFKFHEGQYIIEIYDEGCSELKRNIKGQVVKIADYSL